jgi:hypothetical protein
MNLRHFHLFFITLSALLCVLLALWGFGAPGIGGGGNAPIGVLSIVGAVALATYGIAFRRRSQGW